MFELFYFFSANNNVLVEKAYARSKKNKIQY